MKSIIHAFADVMSQPAAFIALSSLALTGSVYAVFTSGPLDTMTLVNLGISNITMIIGQAVLVSSRRHELAYHLKMDRIIEALPNDNDAIGAEHRDETEIQAAIDQVEQRK